MSSVADGRADLRARIAAWIAAWAAGEVLDQAAQDARFEALVGDLFRWQYESIATYRRFCEQRGVDPAADMTVERIPLVPVGAFKSFSLSTDAAAQSSAFVFETSGTSDGRPGVVRLTEAGLYDASLYASFERFCVPGAATSSLRCISLVPERALRPHSSLGHMVDRVFDRWDDGGGGWYLRQGGDDSGDGVIELGRLLEDLQRAVATGVPVLILATSIGLSFLLERWPDGLQIRLPAGSRLMDTGGPKGRGVAIDRDGQHQALAEALGLSMDAMVGEFGMTELASQRYESFVRACLVGDIEPSHLYFGPPWLRSVALDVDTLAPLADGETGLLGHIDLANLDTCAFVLTADLGRIVQTGDGVAGLELAGRLPGSQWRGCGLDVEALALGD